METGRDDAWKETFVVADSVQALKGSSVLMRPRNGSLEGRMESNIEDSWSGSKGDARIGSEHSLSATKDLLVPVNNSPATNAVDFVLNRHKICHLAVQLDCLQNGKNHVRVCHVRRKILWVLTLVITRTDAQC